jgi:hypothetical protein
VVHYGVKFDLHRTAALAVEQKSKGKTDRNDRLFAVPRVSHSKQSLRT